MVEAKVVSNPVKARPRNNNIGTTMTIQKIMVSKHSRQYIC
jgi:hypothetical protein